jgi:hypothetical protein
MPDDKRNVQIDMQRIPVGSSIGAAVLIAMLMVGMFLDLPGIRGVAVAGGAVGVLFGLGLIAWRRRVRH